MKTLREILTEKEYFLEKELYANSWSAAFGHVARYKKGITQEEKRKMRNSINERLFHLSLDYKEKKWSGNEHFKKIREIKNFIGKTYGHNFQDNIVPYGIIQKLFNLYLKYKWVVGKIDKPPHCPIDSQILKKVEWQGKNTWSKLSEEGYKVIIQLCEANKRKNDTLADWELHNFNTINYFQSNNTI